MGYLFILAGFTLFVVATVKWTNQDFEKWRNRW